MPPRLVVAVLLLAVGPLAAADPQPVARVKLKHDERLAYSSVLPSDDGKWLFVRCNNWSDKKSQLNVVHAAEMKLAGTMNLDGRRPSSAMSRSPSNCLFYNAAAQELTVPPAGVLRTDPDSIAVAQGGLRLKEESPKKIGVGSLVRSGGDRFFIQQEGKVRGLWGLYSYQIDCEAASLDLLSKEDKDWKARLDPRGLDYHGISGMTVSTSGKRAIVTITDAIVDGPDAGGNLQVRPRVNKSCDVLVDLDKMKLIGELPTSSPEVRCSLFFQEDSVAVLGKADGSLQIMDLKKLQPIGDPLPLSTLTIAWLCATADEKYVVALASGKRDHVIIVDLPARKVVFDGGLGEGQNLSGMALSPKGDRLYTLTTNGNLLAWDFAKLIAAKPAK